MIKVFVADDHAVVRQGLKQIVADIDDIEVVGEAGSGRETLDLLSKQDCDIVLLDITMPDKSGLDVLKDLKKLRPELKVLMLTMHPEEQYAIRALRAGACGYLTKESAPDELISAIRKVATGSRYISETLALKLADQLVTPTEEPLHQSLSDREFQIMLMIALGAKVNEIANALFLAKTTISTYRHRILRKMKMSSNAEIARYAIENRLLP